MSLHKQTQDEFEYWLSHMDDALEEFNSRLPPELLAKLDRSPASLDALEAFLVGRYPGVEAIKAEPELLYLDGASRYLGEVFRRALGGQWRIRLDDPKYVYAGLPELSFSKERDTPICPITLITASLDRRTGVYLSTVFRNSELRLARARLRSEF